MKEIKGSPLIQDKKTSVFAVLAFVSGIISLILGWLPVFGWIFIILGAVFGFIALNDIKKNNYAGKGFAVAGLITAGIGLVLAIIAMAAFASGPEPVKCDDINCFIANANDCNLATYEEINDFGKISYSVKADSNYCVFTKEFVLAKKGEDPFIKKLLEGKKLQCSYYPEDFQNEWATSMIDGLEYCDGELKETIGQLLLLT